MHRDVKSPNILVTSNWVGKIGDFGLSSKAASIMSAHSKCEEPDISPLWASPEALRGEPQTERSDAYSFATVLWECLSGELPFEGPLWDVYAAVLDGERPDMSQVRWTDGLQDGVFAARLDGGRAHRHV